jgi:hypothetical protein
MRTRATLGRVLGLGIPTLVVSCAPSFDTSRTLPSRGTLGEELFGVVCDRMGGQSLHEDLTGASYFNICHRPFADKVDQTQLPPLVDGQTDVAGQPVPLAQQQADRAYGVGRMETLAQHRTNLITALDATFPDKMIAVKDVGNADATKSCGAPAASGEGRLHDALTTLLGAFQPLYDDGTIPQATEAVAGVIDAFRGSHAARDAWAVYDARAGYRPIDNNLGAARSMMTYGNPGNGNPGSKQLRDFMNASFALLAADSQPYAPNPPVDADGQRLLTPGPANPQLAQLLATAHAELLNSTADPFPGLLTTSPDAITGRTLLSRPRQDLEVLQALFYAQDTAFGGGTSRYIAARDGRGYVVVPQGSAGKIPTPFVDANGDGLADVDSLGRFVTSDGSVAPSPFYAVGAPDAMARDTFGRALDGSAGSLVYGYVDTSHTYAASLFRNLQPLLDSNPADGHETMMDMVAGAEVLLGTRKSATRSYADGENIAYSAYDTTASPILDLLYAFGQIMADPTAGDTFAFAQNLVSTQTPIVARMVGDGLYAKGLANKDVAGSIPPTSTLWDEMIDLTIQIEQEPGLLEDVLRALGDDASLPLSTVFSGYMASNDHISYDRSNLNGPAFDETTMNTGQPMTAVDRSSPDTGWNRSEMQRFLQAIHDTNGVTACNKQGAVVHALNVSIPILGSQNIDIPYGPNNNVLVAALLSGNYGSKQSFNECEVFKIDNLAAFYLDSIVGSASLYFRDSFIRNGAIGGLGAATVGLIENSSYLGYDSSNADTYNGPDLSQPGFWDLASSQTFRPKPGWLNRLVFFDQVKDSPNPGDPNYNTNHFLTDLQGMQIGTAICPERLIPDPCATGGSATCSGAPDVAMDGMVHGLRQCPMGSWAFDRDQDATFVWEDLGFYNAITPLVSAFATAKNPVTGQPRKREDLFIGLMEILHKHWQSQQGAAAGAGAGECTLTLSPATNCTQDGADSYEPLLAQIFSSDMLTAVHDLVKILQGISVPTCAAADATGKCTMAGAPLDGIAVLANATRALLDPKLAAAVPPPTPGAQPGLVDRHNVRTSLRNDGTTNAQVTPLYLMLEALNEIDAAFVAYAKANPNDMGRQAQWRKARSQLVDQFLSVTGQNTTTQAFQDPSLPKILPVLLDLLRSQVAAHCPGPPFGRCDWARSQLTANAAATIGGPTFAAVMDLNEAIRKNDPARTSLEDLLTYMLDAANGDALAGFMASADDMIQVLSDDANLVPLYHVLATAAAPTTKDAAGHLHRGMVDAMTNLLGRMAGRAYQGTTEICANELDPDEVSAIALANMVSPMTDANGNATESPLEVILDTIADVNRTVPGTAGPMQNADLGNAANELSEFFLDPQRGLEQFYAIVRNGSAH